LVAGDTRLDLLRETGISVDELIHRAERLPSRRVAIIPQLARSAPGSEVEHLNVRQHRRHGHLR